MMNDIANEMAYLLLLTIDHITNIRYPNSQSRKRIVHHMKIVFQVPPHLWINVMQGTASPWIVSRI